jgi:hypothetical protein
MANGQENQFNHVKIYAEDPSQPAIPPNLILEIDGIKMKNIASFNYSVSTGSLPLVSLTLVASVSMSADARVNKSVLDDKDGLQY